MHIPSAFSLFSGGERIKKAAIFILCAAACVYMCSCSQLIPAKGYSILGLAKKSFPDTAVYRTLAFDTENGRIYAANNTENRIDILDTDGTVLSWIDGFTLGGKTETYANVSDLYIHGGRLYAASAGSNRVDVYDIPGNSIVMSLGTGSWSGDTDKATITHPKGVLAADRFVFVASYDSCISVYTDDSIVPANHKKAQKYCFLKLENQLDRTSRVYMEVIDGRLYVSTEDQDKLYVFDITFLPPGGRSQAVEPLSVTVKPAGRRMHGISDSGKFVCTAQSGQRLVFYTKDDFTARKFDTPAGIFTDIRFEAFPQPKNVFFAGNDLYFTTDNKVWKTRWSTYDITEN